MQKQTLVALIHAMVSEVVNTSISTIEGPPGPRGLRGPPGQDGSNFDLQDHQETILNLVQEKYKPEIVLTDDQKAELKGQPGRDGRDGHDFSMEEYRQEILNLIVDNIPKTFDLTDEQKIELKGEMGPRGFSGKDGQDGKDFSFEENREVITQIIQQAALKFEDFTEEQIESLRGFKGKEGKAGKDFDFEESREEINNILVSYIEKIRGVLSFKFEDFTEEQLESLKGPRGQRGKPGKDFDFDENYSKISDQIGIHFDMNMDRLRLKWSDLTPENIDALTLKFEHLSEENRQSLRGSRGQRGKQGLPGIDGLDGKVGRSAFEISDFQGTEEEWIKSLEGKRGARGVIGPKGLDGKSGQDGKDGEDGKDAPVIESVDVEKKGESIQFEFTFDDGNKLRTNFVKIPTHSQTIVNNIMGGGGSSQGGEDGKSAYELALDNGYVGGLESWLESLVGPEGAQGVEGESAYEIAVSEGFVGDINDWLESLKGEKGDTGDVGPQGPPGSGGSGSLAVYDETTLSAASAQNMYFVGDNVRVIPVTTISAWPNLSAVDNMETYADPAYTQSVIIEVKDPSVLDNWPCAVDTYPGAFVYVDSSGIAHNAKADALATSNVVAMVLSKQSTTLCKLKIMGVSPFGFTGLDVSKEYYLSATVAGAITPTAPTSGDIRLRVGKPLTSTMLLINIGERVVTA